MPAQHALAAARHQRLSPQAMGGRTRKPPLDTSPPTGNQAHAHASQIATAMHLHGYMQQQPASSLHPSSRRPPLPLLPCLSLSHLRLGALGGLLLLLLVASYIKPLRRTVHEAGIHARAVSIGHLLSTTPQSILRQV